MKRYLIIFALLLGTVCSYGQVALDQAAVLQKIVNLPELQKYYPKNADGTLKQVVISQYPTSFSEGVMAAMDASKVKFLTPEAVKESKTGAYFMFRGLVTDVGAANASVNYFYDYNYTSGQFRMLKITLELHKTGTVWNVSNLNIGGDK